MSTQPLGHSQAYVSPGMPPLSLGKTTSFFEFWPMWLMYFPVILQWIVLSVRYGSFTLPLLANPKLPLSGMVGISKSLLLSQARGPLNEIILPWFIVKKSSESTDVQTQNIVSKMNQQKLSFPIVCKPDIGCRGSGVKLVKNTDELRTCVHCYPIGSTIMLQKLSDFEPEAGIFFTRQPNQTNGKIISMALKYMPYVVGDGVSTVGELIENDNRAGSLSHLYKARHQTHWNTVIEKDQPMRLVFSASHSKGAIFKDAQQFITPELTQKLTDLMQQLPEFHYGRLDVKFKNINELQRGESIQIVEINTASSESLHIWDSNTDFVTAVSSLLLQYRTLFAMGSENRKKGYVTPSLTTLIKHWQLERKLTKFYPETD